METTVAEIHRGYASGTLTARQLVQLYLDRIEAYDQKGPRINSIVTLNAAALEEADRLDEAYRTSGLVGPLHGIPVMLKDQIDAAGMPTTLGSVLFRDYYPDQDAFVTTKLKEAGAIILAKVTLGEMAAGDTHGSLFGSTRNPYALDRTVGGSSGGPAASIAANFATLSVGQEALASIRRPAAWNSVAGMRSDRRPREPHGRLRGLAAGGGLARTHRPNRRGPRDAARRVGRLRPGRPDHGARRDARRRQLQTFSGGGRLSGARLGILREPIGIGSEPGTADFATVDAAFARSIAELRAAGAVVVDPIDIPDLQALLGNRGGRPGDNAEAFANYFGRSRNPPFVSIEAMLAAPEYDKLTNFAKALFTATATQRGTMSTSSRGTR